MDDNLGWLRQHMRETSEQANPTVNLFTLPGENFGKDARAPFYRDKLRAHTTLDLVYQAAEVIKNLETRANETEARASSIVKGAIQKLELAQSRIQSLESERRADAQQAALKLQELVMALEQAELRIAAFQSRLVEAEVKAQNAESRASESERTLARLEEAIRTQLLGQSRGRSTGYSEAA